MNIFNRTKAAAPRRSLRSLVRRLVRDNFSTFHPIWTKHHLVLLCSLRSKFGSDIDMPIILGVIGQQMFPLPGNTEWGYDEIPDGARTWDEARLTNVESIANATAIPRETVRRKVAELIALGWVSRGKAGRLSITSTAAAALDDETNVIFALQDNLFGAIAEKLEKKGHIVVVSDGAEASSQQDLAGPQ